MAAIPVDADSQITLANARAEARQALNEFRSQQGSKSAAGAAPSPVRMPGSPEFEQPPPPTDDVTAVDNTSDVLGVPENPASSPPPPTKDVVTPEDNGQYSASSAMHFLRDSFKGTGAELETALPRAMLRLGGWLTDAAAGGIFAGEKAFGSQKHYEDAQFNFVKNYINPAIARWTPQRAAQTGDGEGSGGAAQAIGNAAETAPGIFSGGTLLLPQILQQSTDSAMNDVDRGASVTHAIADGVVDGISTWLMSKLGVSPSKSLVMRVVKSAGAGAVTQMGANVAKAGINKAYGDPNAPPPDIFQGVDEAAILGGLFGIKRHAPGAEKGQADNGSASSKSAQGSSAPAGKSTASQPTPATNESTTPPEPTPEVTAAAPSQPSPVPDTPSVEPAKDIKAQFADMNNKLTPRQGVLVTPETQTHLTTLGDKTVDQAKAQGRTIDFPQGTLVLKTKGDVIKVNNRLKAGEDPQTVIGTITGAGTGKTPEATAVVQGRDTTGSVATETAVHPADVPLATQKAEDQGYTPVVTTPEEAIARRVDERNKELKAPSIIEQAAQPAAREPVATPEALPEHESNETPAEPAPRMGLFKIGAGKEVPVHIEEGAPEGQLRVRPIDTGTGEPADRTIDVPAERVRESSPAETENTGSSKSTPKSSQQPEVAPRNEAPPLGEEKKAAATQPSEVTSARKPQTALETLPEALATHIKQETPDFEKKHAAPLSERQDNASAFAAVLRKAAEESRGKADDAVVARANAAAKAAIDLTLKSKNATDKGQGTSHIHVTSVVDEMHRAARELLGTASEEDKQPAVAPKASALKARVKQRKAAEEQPAKKPTKQVAKSPEEVLSTAERLKTSKLANEMIAADFDEYPKAHEKLLAHLHALADAHADFPRAQIDQYMHFLMEKREAAREGKSGRMSDTLEPEEHEFEEPESGFTHTYRPIIDEEQGAKAKATATAPGTAAARARALAARHRLRDEWLHTTDNMESSGFFHTLDSFRNTGEPLSSHFLMDQIIKNTTTPVLRTLLTHIRSRIPDSPVYNRDSIIHMKTGARIGGGKAAGVYHAATNTIQFNFVPEEGFRPFQVKGLVHEMVHAGTLSELMLNPHGELAVKMQQALDILRRRLANKYGVDQIENWTNYFQDRTGSVQRPEGESLRHLYGITNTSEMASEILTNPEFIREVAESEQFANSGENFQGKAGLLTRIFKAIGEFFGTKDPKLLQHIADTTFDVMDAQRQTRPQLYDRPHIDFHSALSPEIHAALKPAESALLDHAFQMIDEPAPPVRGASNRIAAVDEGSGLEPTTREFVHAFGSKAIDALRKTVIAFKTVGQLYSDHARDFGHDDATNPLRALQDSDINKQHIVSKLREITAPAAQKWRKLSAEDNTAVSQLMIDTTMHKLDPRETFNDQSVSAKAPKNAMVKYDELKARYDKLSPAAREVYGDVTDANRKLLRAQRRAGVDVAVSALDADLSEAQRGLLYGAKTPQVYDTLIGKGKLIDVGEKNNKLKDALRSFAGLTELDGPYHHLGRQGDYVVQAEPEGTREFTSRPEAEEFARTVAGLSPDSRAKIVERGGKLAVDFKAQYVSMHETRYEAERERDRLDKLGLNPGGVTQKTLGNAYGALSHGMQELVTEAERKIQKNGSDEGTRALVDSLRSAFLQMQAARSAYAGSRLARKNFGGVKASDMRRNFAELALSAGWHTAQMQTAFERAEAMAKVRSAARDARSGADQTTLYRRGQVVEALNKHAADEVNTFGQKAPFNAMLAKLGFMSFLASPSHAGIWMTQNFTTGIPKAAAKWGYGKAVDSFERAMAAATSPSVRAQMKAAMGRAASSEEVHQVLLDTIAKHPTFGKWATGPNSHLRQLFDRGVISHGYADQLGEMARGPSNLGRIIPGYDRTVERVFGWAGVLPAMAGSINRLSTALAGLEMTGGDIRKTSDFVQEVHADYSAANRPLAFKRLSKIPGGNSITMFATYRQAMAHLLYSNLVGTFRGENKAEAAKTLAGLVVGNALFAGVASAVGIEPLRLALYAYHKIADEEGDVWDFRNAVHRFLNAHFGKTAGDLLASGPLTRVFNVDVTNRMGLSDLFFHNPPDLLTADKGVWAQFAMDQLGPMPQDLARNVTQFYGAAQRGDIAGAVGSIAANIKLFGDMSKAADLYTVGKRDSLGGQLTPPSAVDAITQAIGFKPTDVADAQEKQGARIEYAVKAKQTKAGIVKQIVSATNKGDEAKGWGRLDRWNRLNPTVPITNRDLQQAYKAQERTTYGEPDRNEKAEAATNF